MMISARKLIERLEKKKRREATNVAVSYTHLTLPTTERV